MTSDANDFVNAKKETSARRVEKKATSEFQKPSLSKWGQVHNLSCENEFYLHENEKLFAYQRLST